MRPPAPARQSPIAAPAAAAAAAYRLAPQCTSAKRSPPRSHPGRSRAWPWLAVRPDLPHSRPPIRPRLARLCAARAPHRRHTAVAAPTAVTAVIIVIGVITVTGVFVATGASSAAFAGKTGNFPTVSATGAGASAAAVPVAASRRAPSALPRRHGSPSPLPARPSAAWAAQTWSRRSPAAAPSALRQADQTVQSPERLEPCPSTRRLGKDVGASCASPACPSAAV